MDYCEGPVNLQLFVTRWFEFASFWYDSGFVFRSRCNVIGYDVENFDVSLRRPWSISALFVFVKE